jgi:hypothetical protein
VIAKPERRTPAEMVATAEGVGTAEGVAVVVKVSAASR